MFGIFKREEEKAFTVIDKVWISKQAKWNACAEMLKVNPHCVFVAWFDETLSELKTLLGEDAPIYHADQLIINSTQDKMIVFVEHYPLRTREEDLFGKLQLIEIPVLSGLDEPIFRQFGGENLINIMRRLGVDEKEVLGHDMITSAIKNAQRKLEQKVKAEKHARSQEEWFSMNVPAK